MDSLNDRIVKSELKIYSKCPEYKKDLIKDYWDHDTNFEFKLSPTQIVKKYCIPLKELHPTIVNFSNMSLYLNCDYCDIIEHNTYTSQTGVMNVLRNLRKLEDKKYKCKNCQAIEDERNVELIQLNEVDKITRKQKLLFSKIKPHLEAVNEKRWEKLTDFENLVLKNAMVLNDINELKKYYLDQGILCYTRMLYALQILDYENLLILEFDTLEKTKIKKYRVHRQLLDEYQPNRKANS